VVAVGMVAVAVLVRSCVAVLRLRREPSRHGWLHADEVAAALRALPCTST